MLQKPTYEELEKRVRQLERAESERIKTEKALRASEANLARAQAVAKLGSWRLDIPNETLWWSDETYRIFGLPQGTAMTVSTFLARVHPDDRSYVEDQWAAALQGAPYDIEHRLVVQGAIRWVNEKADISFNDAGVAVEGVGTVQDITDRKLMQEALQQSEEQFRKMFEKMPVGIAFADIHTSRFVRVNPVFCKMLDYTEAELLDMTIDDVSHPDDMPQNKRLFHQAIQGNVTDYRMEKRYIKKNGEVLWANMIGAILDDANGNPVYRVGVLEDITARKRAQRELREREAFLNTLLNAIPIPVFYKDRDGRYVGFNDAFESFLGKPREQLIGKSVFDFNPIDLAQMYHAKDNELFASGGQQRYESQVNTAGGQRRDVIFNKSVYKDSQGDVIGLIGAILDITERKQWETAIRNALAEKEVLLREIHHRVKNNMQVILSLLRMHARKNQNEHLKTIFDDCRSRVEAMSLIHEALHQSDDLLGVDFEAYLKKLCRSLRQVHDTPEKEITLTVDPCHVSLDMDQGVAVGMLICELVSNAFKHAFPSHRIGKVWIRMAHLDSETLELMVADDGKGLPPDFDIRQSRSLGLRLVLGAVERELGGNLNVQSNGGAQFIIRFKCQGGSH